MDLERIAHRAGITACPHCDFDADREHTDGDVWAKTAMVLILDTVQGKHGSVVVVNECLKCFKKSWVHQPFSFFADYHDGYSAEWKEAADAEHTRRHVESVSRFADSLCAKCAHLRSLECDTLPIVECTYGAPPPVAGRKQYLHSSFTEIECPKFVARRAP